MKNDILEVLITEEQLKAKVFELAKEIEKDYEGKDLVAICILKGAMVFLCDIVRQIDLPMIVDVMSVSSYGNSTKSSGVVKILKDLDTDIEGKDVLIIEDIIDTGLTLSYLMELLEQRGAASIKLCSILNKNVPKKADITIDYKGFDIPDAFVVGYGLDYADKYRNLPYVGILKEEVYKEAKNWKKEWEA